MESNLALLSEAHEKQDLNENIVDDRSTQQNLIPEDLISNLSAAVNDVAQLLATERIRDMDTVLQGNMEGSLLMINRVSDVQLYLRRIEMEIQELLMRIKFLDMRREFIRRNFKISNKLFSTGDKSLSVAASSQFLKALQSPSPIILKDTQIDIPQDLHKSTKKNHKHLIDFSTMLKNHSTSISDISGLQDSRNFK